MKMLFFNLFCMSILWSEIKASTLPSYDDYNLQEPPRITMNQAEIDHIKKQIPYLQKLVENSISLIEQHSELKELYEQNEQLNRLKQIKTCIQEVDQENIPRIIHSIEGQVAVLYWLVQCSYIHQQIKKYSENHS